MTTQRRWEDGRPIYHSLPGENEGYLKDPEFNDPVSDPPIADWLTVYWDELLIELQAELEAFPANYLEPATCRSDALDWLAQHSGFTGDYWDASWDDSIKRQLIADAYPFIWENKGTRVLLEYMIRLFNLQANVFILGDFLAGITPLPATLGGDPYTFYITVGLIYLRTSVEWRLLERLRVLYSPVYCDSRICYDQWYAGFSVAGDPVFDELITGPHPDSIAYQNKIIAAGGTIDDYSLSLVDRLFVRPMQKYKDKFVLVHLLCGSNLAAASVALWGVNATPSGFVNADYAQSSGLKGDGTSKYLNLNVLGTSLDANNVGALVYASEISVSADAAFIGALQAIGSPIFQLGRAAGSGLYGWANNNTTSGLLFASDPTSNAFSSGLLAMTANKANGFSETGALKIYRNTELVATGTTPSSPPLPSQNIFAFARSATGATPQLFSSMRGKFFGLTTGLNADELAAIYGAILALNTALGRP